MLKWIDFDVIDKNDRVTPEKSSDPRLLKILNKLIAMLNTFQRNNEYVFKTSLLRHFVDGFRQQRKRVTQKLKNLRMNQISFKKLRHFKATLEYHKTKDILHVMRILGHKRLQNTLVYTHLVDFTNDEYVSKAAKTAEEASKLVEAGFEYVCTTPDDSMLFKKRV